MLKATGMTAVHLAQEQEQSSAFRFALHNANAMELLGLTAQMAINAG